MVSIGYSQATNRLKFEKKIKLVFDEFFEVFEFVIILELVRCGASLILKLLCQAPTYFSYSPCI